jgi:hypothetical protein
MHDPCEIGPHLNWNGIGWKCIFLFVQRHMDLLTVGIMPASSIFAPLGARRESFSIADLSLLIVILSRFSLIMTETFSAAMGVVLCLAIYPRCFLQSKLRNFYSCEFPCSPCRIDAYFDGWYKPLPSVAWRCWPVPCRQCWCVLEMRRQLAKSCRLAEHLA